MCRTNLVATYNYQNGVKQNIDDSDANAFRYCGAYYDKETEISLAKQCGAASGTLTLAQITAAAGAQGWTP